jgi:hypothetical protein
MRAKRAIGSTGEAKPIARHPRESGDPFSLFFGQPKIKMDSRFRGNDGLYEPLSALIVPAAE